MAYLDHTTDKLSDVVSYWTSDDWANAFREFRLRLRDQDLQTELVAIFLFLDGIALIALIFMSGVIL